MNQNTDEIFRRFSELNPNPKIELYYVNDFTLLVAIILSAQTTDKKVNEVTQLLFNTLSTPEEFLSLGLESLTSKIKTIGLFNSKAKNILKMSETILLLHKGNIPSDFQELIALSGVGRKTANVFLNVQSGEQRIAVDTHVFRLSKRIGLSNGKNVLEVEKDLELLIANKWISKVSLWLVLHGRYICKAKKPSCDECFISDLCKKNI